MWCSGCMFDCLENTLQQRIHHEKTERSAEQQLDYLAQIGLYEAAQLVFVDESSVDCCTTYRGHVWSIQGTKAQCKTFFVCSQRFSVLPAISLNDGILHCDVVEGSFCGNTFKQFIE
ncbi:hypothetical protein PAXRUDRAFT_769717 [Paxillus rubicundulus Ve08.2h10]|uniref:DDE-1 domain-containing protein n=1 Tax=Paxillus rubicundulus Ve08.2h10 TaxID=930991 RepID=A0A0D0CV37_9AGAM|nr:hypothetical protein PAXRUDRAFT_769717 [Paxillus rubicundulus Ve08.2h10]